MTDAALFSDGGGDRGAAAAAACIIDADFLKGRKRLVMALGGATNNEAEILGGMVGLSIIAHLSEEGQVVNWYSDSEYTLKSATQYILNWQKNGWRTSARQPVKNLGMWKTYIEVARTLEIRAEHVRGHSGHPENEECDSVSTLVQELQLNGEFKASQRQLRARDEEIWTCVDAKPAMECLRAEEPDIERFLVWTERLAKLLAA